MHCLTFDVEEHFQVTRFDSPMRRRHWDYFESRVASNVATVLDMLARHQTRATFFVLGWVAERHPGLIKDIAASGHEVASHGYSHELITAQTPELFRTDVRRAKHILEDITGRAVHGYRAPGFTITNETRWALPILVEEGHIYDSSIVPIRHDHCGIPGSDPWCHLRETTAGPLWEIPPSTVSMGGIRCPIAGGVYFRLLPFSLLRMFLRQIDRRGHALTMYFHAWEFDRQQPRMEGPMISQLLHYLNLHKTKKRLVTLLETFEFSTIRTYMTQLQLIPPDDSESLSSVTPARIASPIS